MRFFELVDLAKQYARIHDNTISDYAYAAIVENSRWDKVQDSLFAFNNKGVSCVVTPLEADDNICIFRIKINYLSFSLVTPLSPNHDYVSHKFSPLDFQLLHRNDIGKRPDL